MKVERNDINRNMNKINIMRCFCTSAKVLYFEGCQMQAMKSNERIPCSYAATELDVTTMKEPVNTELT
jgi:hypothetical protein